MTGIRTQRAGVGAVGVLGGTDAREQERPLAQLLASRLDSGSEPRDGPRYCPSRWDCWGSRWGICVTPYERTGRELPRPVRQLAQASPDQSEPHSRQPAERRWSRAGWCGRTCSRCGGAAAALAAAQAGEKAAKPAVARADGAAATPAAQAGGAAAQADSGGAGAWTRCAGAASGGAAARTRMDGALHQCRWT